MKRILGLLVVLFLSFTSVGMGGADYGSGSKDVDVVLATEMFTTCDAEILAESNTCYGGGTQEPEYYFTKVKVHADQSGSLSGGLIWNLRETEDDTKYVQLIYNYSHSGADAWQLKYPTLA